MNEEAEGHLDVEANDGQDQQEAQDDTQEQDDSQSDGAEFTPKEQEALKQGWIPPDQYDGPGEGLDAEAFLERGQNHNGILRERNEALAGKISDMESRLEDAQKDFDSRLTTLTAFHKKTLERQRTQLEAKFRTDKRQAAEEGDLQRYDELTQQEAQELEGLTDDLPDEAEKEKKKDDEQTIPPAWKAAREKFLEKNVWFNTDPEMTQVAAARHRGLITEKPGLTPDENFAEVEKFMRSAYPSKFGGQKRTGNGTSFAEGGNRQGGGSSKKGWRDIPAEERGQIKELIEDGIYETEAEAAKDYWTHYEEG